MKGKTFKEPIFIGVTEGRITQFREIMKPQPDFLNKNGKWFYDLEKDKLTQIKPRYKVGETVYIKEPYYMPINIFGQEFPDRRIEYIYGDEDGLIESVGFVMIKEGSTLSCVPRPEHDLHAP